MDLRELFATNLRRLRNAKGIPQDELAYEAGVSRSYLSQLETGKFYASLKVLGRLADALEVEPAEIPQASETALAQGAWSGAESRSKALIPTATTAAAPRDLLELHELRDLNEGTFYPWNAMQTPSALDPRAVANLLLDLARPNSITNLALQKLLYFAHGKYLIETQRPLVSGYFEAWQYGPVHPLVYHAFKECGDRPIDVRATGADVLTGERFDLPKVESSSARDLLAKIVAFYGPLTPGRLVEISHASNAPWDIIVKRATRSLAFGLRIPDDLIVERFKFHKVLVCGAPTHGEPGDEIPLFA